MESPLDCSLCNISVDRFQVFNGYNGSQLYSSFQSIRYNNKENVSSYRYRVFLLNLNANSVRHKIVIQHRLTHCISYMPKYIIMQSSSSI